MAPLATTVCSLKYPFLSGFGNLAQFDSDSGSFSSIFTVLVGLFSITWSILTIYNYFQTKKAIAKFPPSSTDADSTEKVVSAFRKSIYVILVLPIVVMFIGGFIGAYKFSQKITEGSLPKEPIGRPQDYESVLTFFSMENSLEDFLSPVLISNWVYFFATVVFLFFIWIKDNNGLIIDRNVNDPIENADVSQFDVSSDNE
ncbi:hypothetical protein G210_5188 [Candida maltosa Xu316]|uniref:Uncharacterized protein n=1 Tax=Candida maltosa (strain Xu316) TaxID=1245528 RepID=M3K544_CANMX|nr:hypothetical protein G210_5188 [Candida maltosa Xu316]